MKGSLGEHMNQMPLTGISGLQIYILKIDCMEIQPIIQIIILSFILIKTTLKVQDHLPFFRKDI